MSNDIWRNFKNRSHIISLIHIRRFNIHQEIKIQETPSIGNVYFYINMYMTLAYALGNLGC